VYWPRHIQEGGIDMAQTPLQPSDESNKNVSESRANRADGGAQKHTTPHRPGANRRDRRTVQRAAKKQANTKARWIRRGVSAFIGSGVLAIIVMSFLSSAPNFTGEQAALQATPAMFVNRQPQTYTIKAPTGTRATVTLEVMGTLVSVIIPATVSAPAHEDSVYSVEATCTLVVENFLKNPLFVIAISQQLLLDPTTSMIVLSAPPRPGAQSNYWWQVSQPAEPQIAPLPSNAGIAISLVVLVGRYGANATPIASNEITLTLTIYGSGEFECSSFVATASLGVY